MQKCQVCGAYIKYIATGPGKSVACDAEKLQFVTENGRQTFGHLIHRCYKAEGENAKEQNRE